MGPVSYTHLDVYKRQVQNVAQYYMKLHGLGQVEYHYGVMDNFYTIYFIF